MAIINWTGNYFLCFMISILLAGLIIPKVMRIAFSKKLFDVPDERKIHKGVVPRLGGVSFLPAIMFSFCVVVGYTIGIGPSNAVTAENLVPLLFYFCATLLIFLVGIADDLIGVRYSMKFLFQIAAGALIVSSGLWVHGFDGLLWIEKLPNWLGWILTVIYGLYIMNAINLIDGIDGLAAGVSMIALAFYSYVLFRSGQFLYCLLAGAALGTLVPFFFYNVFGRAERRNKIFMGDTGSLTIGTLLFFLSVTVFNIPATNIGNENLFILAVAPVMLPCFDVARVFIHRIRRGTNPFLPDKGHLHHKLLALGFPQWKALICILVADTILVGVNLLLCAVVDSTWLLLGDILIWTIANIWITAAIRKRERITNLKLYD